MHNGLTIPSFRQPIKYLKPWLLFLNLSDTTLWSTFTDNKSIGSLDSWNSFLLSLILLNFSVFSLVSILRKKQKNICFLVLVFYIEPILDNFSLVLFNLVFFSCDKFL